MSKCTLRIVKREDGTGEVIDAVPVSREFLAAGANVGTLNNLGGYLTDGSGYRVRPIRFPLEATASVLQGSFRSLVNKHWGFSFLVKLWIALLLAT